MDKKSKFAPAKKKQVLILVIIISLFITYGAYQFYEWETANIRQQKEKTLTAIATLKIKQIEDWFRDELNDAHLISRSPALLESVRVFSQNPSRVYKESLLSLLNQIKTEHDYSDVILSSLDGKIILSTSDQIVNLNSVEKTTLKAVIDKGKSLCTDLFPNDNSGKQPVLISFVSVGDNLNNNTSFALIVRMDPDDFLYPLVESWPVPSSTSETFIFRVENDNILYLNNLRHKNIKVLDYKIPLSNADLPAVKAAAGYKGIYTGKDYRNVDVFAYMDKIKDTPWYLISKIDKSEMFEELPLLAIYVIGFTFLSILTIGSVLTLLYNRRQKTIYAELYKKEKEIWQQQEKFKVTLDSLGEGVITLDINGKIRYMNNIAEDLTGWNLRESRGRYLGDIYSVKNEETGESENNILEKVLKHGIVKELANHTILISKSGKEIPVMDTGAPIYDSDGSVIGIVIAFQDETEKRTQQRMLKESEDRLRSSLDGMIEGCQIIGYDYKYLFLNKAALQSSRKTSEELLGKTMMECYPGIENTSMFSKVKSCMEERIPSNFENEFTYPDGEKKFFNLRFEPVPEGIFILSEDITDYKLAQDFILKFKMGIELSGDAIFLTDKEGIITYVNPAFEKTFGYTKEEAIGNTPRILKSGIVDQEYYEKFWQDILAMKAVNHEIINKTKDNKLLYIEASINPIINEKNEVLGFIAIERDITERKVAEEKRKQLTAIIEATPDFVATADAEGNSIFINNAGKKMLGLEPDEDVTKITIADAHPDWARKIVLEEGLPTAAKEGFWIGETAFLHRNGHETPISQIIIAHRSKEGEVEYYSTIARDITQRKQFEEEIIEKTTILESFFDNTLTLIALLDKDFNFIRVNKAYADADERDVDFFIGKNHFDLYPSEAKEIFEEVVRTKTSYQAIERPFTYANNPERGITYWDWNLVPLLDENGEVESLIFNLLNVTDRIKAKEELIRNEKFLTTLFNSVNDAIFTVTMSDRTIKSVNKAVSDLFGYDPGEIIGKTTRVLYQSNEAFHEYGDKLSAAIKENKHFVRAELKLQKKDGTVIFCDVQTTFLKSAGRDDLVISVLRDITEKKKIMDELIAAKEKAEEMNEVKTLFFANMSHELRTPFVGIMGYAELLADELEDPELNAMAQGILSTSKRMMETLTKILSLSKVEIKGIEVNNEMVILKELFDTIQKEYLAVANKKNISLETTIEFEDAVVQTDKSLLYDILHNLVNNAINYTNEGEIFLKAEKKLKDNKEILSINVSDTGIGIPKDKQEIVWQEFRQVSEGRTRSYQGTGLGLTIAKKYTELLGGNIYLQSEEGKGSTFSVELPLTD